MDYLLLYFLIGLPFLGLTLGISKESFKSESFGFSITLIFIALLLWPLIFGMVIGNLLKDKLNLGI